ncbi:MAG: DNA polymerase III subunit gamma/tau [Paracoccaceae bacterium]|jgi:DNA polymerase-3 subunit gamma/tau|tara:strand:+ start:4557 stop:6305 length:1749 start_codon:yes stop_codon:yes gene_type:complete
MTAEETTKYQVLARKYRPETFSDLIGQEAMVRTLKNAFDADRIAQAFMMTGIRGVGKTTTARIIAKGMNCIGLEGNTGPTTSPCGQCEHCVAISEGRHVDVLEMDAASRTGVDDIREIIDSVHYRAASARFKIYIIDEVHMLSNNAFNALLKTLEEPPEHVKFIFATTEIRKVPVTVLSRCQRFDLRRIEPEEMIKMLQNLAKLENASISNEALALITRASEGSARDAQSLLDQAISHGAGETSVDQVRAMLGLADRGRVLDLFEFIMRGQAKEALNELGSQYSDGADPIGIIRDLAEVTHWVSIIKITPDAADDPTVSPDEKTRGQAFSQSLSMRILTRTWQLLLKALEEISSAPNPMMAAEMAVIRITHVSDLPSPEELVKKLTSTHSESEGVKKGNPGKSISNTTSSNFKPTQQTETRPIKNEGNTALALDTETLDLQYPTFESVLEIIRKFRDMKLLIDVENSVRLSSYVPGRIEFTPTENAPKDLAQRLGQLLQNWTGFRWAITVVGNCSGETIQEQRNAKDATLKREAKLHPFVKTVFDNFPKASIVEIKSQAEIVAEAEETGLPEIEGEWDPFEE